MASSTESTPRDGGPAFPPQDRTFVVHSDTDPRTLMDALEGARLTGMSLRDWFAGQALAGLFAHLSGPPSAYARDAYQIADAMLAMRGRS